MTDKAKSKPMTVADLEAAVKLVNERRRLVTEIEAAAHCSVQVRYAMPRTVDNPTGQDATINPPADMLVKVRDWLCTGLRAQLAAVEAKLDAMGVDYREPVDPQKGAA